ncbi:hypothetical protein [Absidia glauca]|uniref:Myb-like domain-containing protein n=1 Tax=Absidia glauca TaxID=4829 RepID=A0A163JAK8_ABSGL|nr:hypothetical protein [Absidia glauca]
MTGKKETTSVMDLKHILCQPVEEPSSKQGFMVMMHPQTQHPLDDTYREHTRSISGGGHRINRSNSIHGSSSSGPYTLTPRKRVHSEHYRTSPLFSWGQPTYHHHHQEEVLIAPLSTNMVPTLSSSSSSSSLSTLSPSSSTSTLSSPTTPTLTTPQRPQQQKKPSVYDLHNLSPPATRTPWTPMEDDLLQKGYEQGLSWAMISATYLPRRSRGCCWGRFKTLQSKNLIDVKVQQQSRLARRAWKNMDVKKSASSSLA